MSMRRAMRAVTCTVTTVLGLGSLAFLLLFAVGPQTGAYRTLTVLSGSMEPAFAAGDAIIVTPQPARTIKQGDVIVYRAPVGDRATTTHRILRIVRSGARPVIETKGDANAAADPWQARLAEGTVWRQRFVVPYAGRLIGMLHQPALASAAPVLFPVLVLALMLQGIWKRPGGRKLDRGRDLEQRNAHIPHTTVDGQPAAA